MWFKCYHTLSGAVTWRAIYGCSDKGTDVLDVSQVGKVLQHTAASEHGGWLIHSHRLGVYQMFRLLFSLKVTRMSSSRLGLENGSYLGSVYD